MSLPPIVLFDIDGTLVSGPDDRPSAGLMAMNRASFLVTESGLFGSPEQMAGKTDAEIASSFTLGDPREFAGRTDVQIAEMLLRHIGEPVSKGLVQSLIDEYLKGLAIFIDDAPYTALGDVEGCVSRLNEIEAIVGIGTGNVERGARLKLNSAGISAFFDFSLGGYGDDGETRAQVLQKGALRCGAKEGQPVVIVGDTPRDINAAKEIGAHSIGIPFKQNTKSVLWDAGADAVYPCLSRELALYIEQNLIS